MIMIMTVIMMMMMIMTVIHQCNGRHHTRSPDSTIETRFCVGARAAIFFQVLETKLQLPTTSATVHHDHLA
jgi:hypothetical protein